MTQSKTPPSLSGEFSYAQVVVDVPHQRLSRPFHYAIPPGLRDQVVLGVRVKVPFGHRDVMGLVVGLSAQSPVEEVKEIHEVVDEAPLVTEELIQLSLWISQRYLTPWASSISAILPPGIQVKSLVSYRLLAPAQNPQEEALASIGGEGTLAAWEAALGRRPSLLKLLEEGRVEKRVHWLSPKVRPQLRKGYRLLIPGERARQIAVGLTRAPRQAQALEFLANQGGPVLLSDLPVAASALTPLVERGILAPCTLEVYRDPLAGKGQPADEPPELTTDQSRVLEDLRHLGQGSYLLQGVTGSGKTEVYLRLIQDALDQGRGAMVLVPEISLTPQMVQRFTARFGERIAILHSALGMGERYDQWRRIRNGDVPVVVGARSAVFAPLSDIGLIVLDEEHEGSYKQDEGEPKYHARDVAQIRAQWHGALLVLGSATPSLETRYLAETGEIGRGELPGRVQDRPMPTVELVDMREELAQGHRKIFSRSLQKALTREISRGYQAILFLNRRGFSSFLLCRACGLVLRCPHCDVSLTYHSDQEEILCHYCGHHMKVPRHCPGCQSPYLRHFGTGTQRVAAEVEALLPGVRVARLDQDTARLKGAHEEILGRFGRGEAQVLVGTQMIAKGLDNPRVTLVGVVAADLTLHLPDFRSAERTFQLLTQVAGRAGRGRVPGSVIVQTYDPDHYAVALAGTHDYESFYRQEIGYRRRLSYPPFRHLALLVASSAHAEEAQEGIERVAQYLSQWDLEVIGPAPAPLSRVRDLYRWHMILRAREWEGLTQLLGEHWEELQRRAGEARLNATIDPLQIL